MVATFRCYEELNDFIARDRRRQECRNAGMQEFDFDCAPDATIKDLIEALGVPHTKVAQSMTSICTHFSIIR